MNGVVIQVIDRDGWRKQFPIERNLVHIGSSPHNDVPLDVSRGGGVSARHIQILSNPSTGKYRVVNLAQSDVDAGGQVLPPRAFMDIDVGRVLKVGEFQVSLEGDASGLATVSQPATQTRRSPSIGGELNLSHKQLTTGTVIEASLHVKNDGDATNAQFQIGVEGLPAEHIEIGPGPILFPGAEKRIPVELSHPKSSAIPAGARQLTFYISAPDAYPGELTTLTETIQIMPFQRHAVGLREL